MPKFTDKPPKYSLRNVDSETIIRTASRYVIDAGRLLHAQNRGAVVSADDLRAELTVNDALTGPRHIETWLDDVYPDRYLHLTCDCLTARENNQKICSHKVCALLTLRSFFRKPVPPRWSRVLDRVLAEKDTTRKPSPKHILLFAVCRAYSRYSVEAWVIPIDHVDQSLQNDREALGLRILDEDMFGHLKSVHNKSYLNKLLDPTLVEMAAVRVITDRWRPGEVSPDEVLPLISDSIVFHYTMGRRDHQLVKIHKEPASVEISVAGVDDGLSVDARVVLDGNAILASPKCGSIISEKPLWVLMGSDIFKVDENADFLRNQMNLGSIQVPSTEENAFFEKYLPVLSERARVTGDALGDTQELAVEMVPRIYLSESDHELNAELRFAYDRHELPLRKEFPESDMKWDPENRVLIKIQRDSVSEQRCFKSISSYGMKRDPNSDGMLLRQNTSPVDFLVGYVPKLVEAGFEVYGEDDIKSVRINRSVPKMKVSVSSGIDWFDVKAVASFGDLEVPLADIRKAVKKHERFIKLCDGSIGEIPKEWIDRYRHLFNLSKDTEDGMRLTRSQLMILDAAVEEAEWDGVDEQFLKQRERLKNITSIEPRDLTEGFVGELRHYQKFGYDWLHFLHDNEFGGCLADDMGLGKTIQALVFLNSLRKSGHAKRADLVVMPKSLLENWKRESSHFTPDARVLIHAESDRIKDEKQFDDYDLVLTTYGIMLRDVDILSAYRFHYVILDESQAVKNPVCLTGKAARLLKGDHKLVLTGTPVENSTSELWSQFAFINPGMLGSLDYFTNEFVNPIERRGDRETAEHLRKLVYPFILRRTKEKVAPELPPKTERVIYCEMEAPQQQLYNQARDRYRAELLGLIDSSGMNEARMKILEGLLRLRQLANHPKLIDKAYTGGSVKLEVLMEELETLRAEGHKALVFSQFTQMLKLIRAELDAKQIPYMYLDGHTQNRQEKVDAFQNDTEMPFFLISLRAGGVGLNLTAADYVIHIDPWWNPAVERQASDRTHRIGQENPVFINRLIAKGTVEEKILELQDRKRDLVDQLISNENGFFKSLNADDVKDLFS
jgi:non-specific serine/threonine protein kinase